MKENINIVDRDYGSSQEEVSRPIKTRGKSFNSILSNFKKELLEARLNQMQDSAVSEKYDSDMSYKSVQSIASKRATAIAKLEEKILVLSRDDVPQNYVESRAIKLRDAMMDNLTKNASSAYNNSYSIGYENKDNVFGDFEKELGEQSSDDSLDLDTDGVLFSIQQPEETDEKDDAINVVPTEFERKDIEDSINEEFAAVDGTSLDETEVQESHEDSEDKVNFVTPEEVKETVDKSTEVAEDETVNNQEIKNVIDSALDNINIEGENLTSDESTQSVDNDDDKADYDSIKDEIDRALEKVRISSNNSSVAKIDKYTSNEDTIRNEYDKAVEDVINKESPLGVQSVDNEEIIKTVEDKIAGEDSSLLSEVDREMIRREVQKVISKERNARSGYVPMSDEEVAESQHKIASTEHLASKFKAPSFENLLKPVDEVKQIGEQVRDLPVVVPDRDAYEPVIEEDLVSSNEAEEYLPVSRKNQIDTFNALKNRLKALKEHQRVTQQERDMAQKNAETIADKAKEARRLADESDKLREEQLKRLQEYTESIEEECKNNEKNRVIAENDAVMNNNFIEEQLRKIEENSNVIDEIDSLISGRAR